MSLYFPTKLFVVFFVFIRVQINNIINIETIYKNSLKVILIHYLHKEFIQLLKNFPIKLTYWLFEVYKYLKIKIKIVVFKILKS